MEPSVDSATAVVASPRQRIALVADRAVRSRYFVWDWGEAIAIQALIVASGAIGEPRFGQWASSRLDLWRQIHPDPFWPDHLGPGVALVWHYVRTGEPEILEYAERVGRHLASLPKATTGARLLRPDKPDLETFVWVDSLYSDGPFLCELGRVTGNDEYFNEGASQTEGICASVQHPASGLFAHRYDDATETTNGVFWGRGCGWAALGLGHTLAALPRTHPAWNTLAHRLQRFAATAATLQSSSGHWNAILDRPDTRLESSTTALIGEGLALGIDAAALSEEYRNTVERAWSAVATEVAPDGRVENVSQRSPSSTAWEDYAKLPHGGCYAWGQGPWLIFACRFLPDDGDEGTM
ncbi:MAG: glycoside hydrolase family 88 protein [Chloroflexia bacterium]|nr:glycoside hydrolase family 88 protein [Chloroflexia bacterium]